MLKLVYIPLYILWFISLLFAQVSVRTIYRIHAADDELTEWFNFTYDNNWSEPKIILYEMFFLDLFVCHKCGKLRAYKGKYCEDCKDEVLKEEI